MNDWLVRSLTQGDYLVPDPYARGTATSVTCIHKSSVGPNPFLHTHEMVNYYISTCTPAGCSASSGSMLFARSLSRCLGASMPLWSPSAKTFSLWLKIKASGEGGIVTNPEHCSGNGEGLGSLYR